MGMENGRWGTLCVDVASFYCGSQEIWADFSSLRLHAGRAAFFSKSSAIAEQKEGLEQEKSKDDAMGMEGGRYGTFCVEDLEFLLRISADLS